MMHRVKATPRATLRARQRPLSAARCARNSNTDLTPGLPAPFCTFLAMAFYRSRKRPAAPIRYRRFLHILPRVGNAVDHAAPGPRAPPGAPVSPPVTTDPKGTMMNTIKKIELKRLLSGSLSDAEIEQLISQGVQRTIAAAKTAGVALKTRATLYALPDGAPVLVKDGRAVRLKAPLDATLMSAIREWVRQAEDAEFDALLAALTNERGFLEEGRRQGAQLPRGKASRTLPGVFPMNPQLAQQLRAEIETMPAAAFDGLIAALMTERAMFLEAEGRTPEPTEGETGMPAAATKSTAGWLDDFFGLPPVAAQQAAQQAPRGVFDQLDAWARNALQRERD